MWRRMTGLVCLATVTSCATQDGHEDTFPTFEEPPMARLSEVPLELSAAPVKTKAKKAESNRVGAGGLGLRGSGFGGGGTAEGLGGLGTKGIGSGASGYGSGSGSFGSRGAGGIGVARGGTAEVGLGPRGFSGTMVHTGKLSQDWTDYGHNQLENPASDWLSTFSIDVDTGAYTQARRMILAGTLPPPESVRTEEFINYQKYRYPQPERGLPFSITMEATANPWNNHHILRVGIQGARPIGERDPVHLTFLIDTSGSMQSADKMPLAKNSLSYLVEQLGPGDTVAIVTYAGGTRVVLRPTDAQDSEQILDAIQSISGGGGTAMESGMKLAYDMALEALVPGEENRVIVLSDGDANIGASSHDSILHTLESYAKRGITLSTVGFGTGNYRDTLMEQLADKGDGNYVYIDTFDEARRVFGEDMVATLQTIARDVKIQVEFDSTNVMAYRLIGYENRDIADRDFRNDKVDAGEVGAGHTVTALYDLVLRDNLVGDLATVRVRHKKPGPDSPATEQAVGLPGSAVGQAFWSSTKDMRLAWGTASFAEKLRDAPEMQEINWSEIAKVVRSAARNSSERDDGLLALIKAVDGRIAAPIEPVAQELVDQVIRRHMNQVRYCYQRELIKMPEIAGRVEIEFVIAPDGSVHAAKTAKTTLDNTAVEACVVSRFMRMQFPPSGLSSTVSYPFTFKP